MSPLHHAVRPLAPVLELRKSRLVGRSQWVDATLGRDPLAGASIAKSRSRALIQTEHHPG